MSNVAMAIGATSIEMVRTNVSNIMYYLSGINHVFCTERRNIRINCNIVMNWPGIVYFFELYNGTKVDFSLRFASKGLITSLDICK